MGGDEKHESSSSPALGNLKELPVEIPEFETIKPDHEQLMTSFIEHHKTEQCAADPVQQNFLDAYDHNWRTVAYKFLVARRWNVADATSMYKDTMSFRTRMGFHRRPMWPPAVHVRGYDLDDVQRELNLPLRTDAFQLQEGDAKEGPPQGTNRRLFVSEWDRLYSVTREYHPKSVHYWDKAGHPVYYERIPGNHKAYLAAFKGALAPERSVFEAWEDYHWHMSEVCSIITRYQHRKRSATFGRDITSCTIVMDCAQLGYGILFSDVRRLCDKVWSDESKVVPEGLHRVFVVNSPGIITFAYGLLKHVIPKRTQEKVVIVGKDKTREVLTHIIDADKVPKDLGGTCECVGGCLA